MAGTWLTYLQIGASRYSKLQTLTKTRQQTFTRAISANSSPKFSQGLDPSNALIGLAETTLI